MMNQINARWKSGWETGLMMSATRKTWLAALCLLITLLAGIMLMWDKRLSTNDALLAEIRLLKAAHAYHLAEPTSEAVVREHEQSVYGNRGYVLRYDGMYIESNEWSETIVLGWTNSVLGAGSLLLADRGILYWSDEGGTVWRVRDVDIRHISVLWYLRSPVSVVPGARVVRRSRAPDGTVD